MALTSTTCIIISVDDGLLRTRTYCAGPPFSLTRYDDRSKDTVTTVRDT